MRFTQLSWLLVSLHLEQFISQSLLDHFDITLKSTFCNMSLRLDFPIVFLFFLAMLHGIQDLNSLTRG